MCQLQLAACMLDPPQVQQGVQEATAGLCDALCTVQARVADAAATDEAVAVRLERRRAELARAEKRLATLASVRPAYMDEFEVLSTQLQVRSAQLLEQTSSIRLIDRLTMSFRGCFEDLVLHG